MYSRIILEDNSEHIVPNDGWVDLNWWINYFTYTYNKEKEE